LSYAPFGHIAARRLAERRLERLAEVVWAQARLSREGGKVDRLAQMRFDIVDDTPLARATEPAANLRRRFGALSVSLEQAQRERCTHEVQAQPAAAAVVVHSAAQARHQLLDSRVAKSGPVPDFRHLP